MKKHRFLNSNTQSRRLTDGRYAYYPAEGEPIYITPGVDASEEIFILLDQLDHEADLSDRYADRHRDGLIDCIKRKVEDCNDSTDSDPIDGIADPCADIFSILYPEEKPKSRMIEALKAAMERLTPQQIDFIYERYGLQMSEVEIARRDGVSKQAIDNRRTKLFKRIRKLMEEYDNR